MEGIVCVMPWEKRNCGMVKGEKGQDGEQRERGRMGGGRTAEVGMSQF